VVRRNALGRGLDALLPPSPPPPGATREPASTPYSVSEPPPVARSEDAALAPELPIDDIAPNPDQPRRHFAEDDLAALADSIQRHGVLQPVVVRRARAGAERPYELVVGERRWRASQRAGRTTLPATIQDVAPDALLEIALVENVQRADLNPIELALAFRALADGGLTQEQVGQRVGLDRSTVANHLRLLELPRELQQDVETGALTAGHAKALLQLTNPERRHQLRERIVDQGLSVRAAEESARELAGPGGAPRKRPAPAVDPNLQDLINSLQAHLQTRVRIIGGGRRGKIEIDFHGAEELHRVTLAMLEGGRPS
jgi:ParB family chromosome partitioning protein